MSSTSCVYTCSSPGQPLTKVERDENDNVTSTEVEVFPGDINHSQDGCNWGYQGSGPAQCAAAILWDYYGEDIARKLYMRFKAEIISQCPGNRPLVIPASRIVEWFGGIR